MMRACPPLALLALLGCSRSGTHVPLERAPVAAASVTNFCTIDLVAPEVWHATLHADDVAGVDCVPPAGGEVFSLGVAHAGWWLQLDVARRSIALGAHHPFDGQAALLALDCWEWNGGVTVDADDEARWAVRLDARCRDDETKAVVGSISGAR
ncbi:MAG TPA: hypothetical protein VF945_14605 [Polyangia bacterium]